MGQGAPTRRPAWLESWDTLQKALKAQLRSLYFDTSVHILYTQEGPLYIPTLETLGLLPNMTATGYMQLWST